ncbi:chaperone protein dnaJ C76, chloroplastic-like [Diospyros lotus]|uniref:chaperone protein dnaJ C76, chloroplastic-like n=1 Tax=Diospyros lotus TaxID=55363 RepID=UPI0022557231|nr:chaperone protein dnaJ C76, chloroplastic-like [Diospyros lotus]
MLHHLPRVSVRSELLLHQLSGKVFSKRKRLSGKIRSMLGGAVSCHHLTVPNHFQLHKPASRWRWQKSTVIKCCKRAEEGLRTEKNYYELLGVSVDSTPQDIKGAYRKLQKKYHPDIAGQRGHEYTLMLNKAYKVLIREDLRREYDASIGQLRVSFGRNIPGLGSSSWEGPIRSHALFVDENACIGCRECIHHASNTFTMDESLASARVRVQYGDDDTKLEVAVDSCPVNCIHWVDGKDLPVLEFLMRPRPKEGHGVFGQGWERPKNVFSAAKAFAKQLQQEAANHPRTGQSSAAERETPAQAEARARASMKLKEERFPRIWTWVREILGR